MLGAKVCAKARRAWNRDKPCAPSSLSSAHVKQFPALCSNPIALTLTAAAAIALLYWPAFVFTGFGDDYIYILGNPKLQSAEFWEVLSERMNGYEFLPLRDLTYWLDWQIAGNAILPYHLHNLLWYLASCIAAGFCARGLLALAPAQHPAARWIPLATAALFLIHPLHIEPVVWISGRKDLMSGTFLFLAAGLWAQGLARDRPVLLWSGIACFALALMSKSPSVVFVAPALLLWLARGRNAWSRHKAAAIAALIVLGLASIVVSVSVGGESAVLSKERVNTPLAEQILLAARILGQAAAKSVLPIDLRLTYDELFPSLTPGWNALALLGLACALAALVAVVRYLQRPGLLALGTAWFAAFMLPYLQLIPFRTTSPFCDRFAFVASFGICLLAADLLLRAPRAWRTPGAALVVLALLLASAARSPDWRSVNTLLLQDAQHANGGVGPYMQAIAYVYLPAARYAEARAAADAIHDSASRQSALVMIEHHRLRSLGDAQAMVQFLRRVVREQQAAVMNSIDIANLISESCVRYGLLDEAEMIYRSILSDPNMPAATRGDTRHNYALILERRGRTDEAARSYLEAARTEARDRLKRAVSWNSAAILLKAQGDWSAAESAFLAAIALDRNYAYPVINLANLYRHQGRQRELEALLEEAGGRLPEVRQRFRTDPAPRGEAQ